MAEILLIRRKTLFNQTTSSIWSTIINCYDVLSDIVWMGDGKGDYINGVPYIVSGKVD